MSNYTYDTESLKIVKESKEQPHVCPATIHTNSAFPDRCLSTSSKPSIVKDSERELSNGRAALILVMLVAMYVAVSAIPTAVLMIYFHFSFWTSQGISLLGIILIVWTFGLYKPASREQLAKSKFLL